jgi:hypothetical protein
VFQFLDAPLKCNPLLASREQENVERHEHVEKHPAGIAFAMLERFGEIVLDAGEVLDELV